MAIRTMRKNRPKLQSVECSVLRWSARLFLFVSFSLFSRACLAGAPFLTDDPVPVYVGRWEINNYASGNFAKGAFVGVLPGVDANYGAFDIPDGKAPSSGPFCQHR